MRVRQNWFLATLEKIFCEQLALRSGQRTARMFLLYPNFILRQQQSSSGVSWQNGPNERRFKLFCVALAILLLQ
jgi:hypothetical protein